jgi:prefoldin subunit 5
MTWREKYRRDPDLAESIIESLKRDFEEAEKRIEVLETALKRIRDYHGNWAQSMRQIAREALE